ncbi:hypothetical protein GCM10007382_17030 [Salinibacterium xinjiangense]|uniref:Nucleotidyl transferase AbiEii toxin, Type IV TA system n=2 Tax=Microbacteriaceae TaxID=85023 RepID=A0A2C8YIW3_9MICO|nr:hypothetical protein [Salinibacterium xinjiangense]GGK97377.1 hypothetical protein GCM10007382_17030 [Salinibacterium xinjiangense]SOE50302.1 hypothetical protein SAMN06296378_0361 [Salinibacterium xinjiangense]
MPNLYEDESGVIRALVDRLGHDLEPSILIGGWATFVRVGGEISLDIDLITSQESRHKLEQLMTDLSPSNNHQGRKLRATIDDVHLDIYLPYESQLGGKLRLKVEVLAEYPDELSFEKWTLLRLEAHIATKMAALLDRHFSEKGQKDAREILALLKLEGVDPAAAAEVLDRASTVDIQQLPVMIGEAFDLIGTIVKLSKADQKLISSVKKSWVSELQRRGTKPQTERPQL